MMVALQLFYNTGVKTQDLQSNVPLTLDPQTTQTMLLTNAKENNHKNTNFKIQPRC